MRSGPSVDSSSRNLGLAARLPIRPNAWPTTSCALVPTEPRSAFVNAACCVTSMHAPTSVRKSPLAFRGNTMSASVTCISERIRERLARPLTDAEQARKMVADRLAGTNVQPERIRHAQNRAERSVSAGFRIDLCVQRAVEWALSPPEEVRALPVAARSSSFDPSDPPPPLAA